MRRYKVIALSVGGRRNKIYKAGDTVYETNFPEGHAEELVRQKVLQEDGEEDNVPEWSADPHELYPTQVKEEKQEEETPEPKPKKLTIEEISFKELLTQLRIYGIPIEKDASKEQLYNRWINTVIER